VGASGIADLEWEGQTDVACAVATVYLQIYNYDGTVWENVDSDSTTVANTDFALSGNIADLTNYKSGDIITCRVYQLSA